MEYGVFKWSGLTSITIPAGVESLNGALGDAWKLTSVELPAGLTSVGGCEFSGTALTSITIPAGVTTISHDAFFGCKPLQTINLPANAKLIGIQGEEVESFNNTSARVNRY